MPPGGGTLDYCENGNWAHISGTGGGLRWYEVPPGLHLFNQRTQSQYPAGTRIMPTKHGMR